MKKIVLGIFTIILSTSAFAADLCSKNSGSLIYDSATTVGNSVVIMNPKIRIGNKDASIQFSSDYGKNKSLFCNAFGLREGTLTYELDGVSSTERKLIAVLSSSDGSLLSISNEGGGVSYISMAVCNK